MPSYIDDAVRAADDLIKRLGGGKPIRAYHGSPYDFDRFDASKIGTGEGEQAYGHGLYFAGVEDVAKGYRDATRWQGVDTSSPAARAALFAHRAGDGSVESAIRAMEDAIQRDYFGGKGLDGRLNRQAIEYLRAGGEIAPPPLGRMYEVQIAHPEEALLDWDAPMSKQPKLVQRAFGDMAMDMPGDGRRVYHDILTRRGEEFDDDMTGALAHRAATQELLQEGIPGIRYLDQGSRAAGEGTRNYVMFPGTEDSITILRKYGLLPPLAGAAAMQESDEP